MFSPDERNTYFVETIKTIGTSDLVEGVIQLGSGVIGYKDEYSDIDLMVATFKKEDAEETKNHVHQILRNLKPILIKEKQFTPESFLVIAILPNKLEFNISIVARELLPVRSPLWKVVVDKTGLVMEKMGVENEKFVNRDTKYTLNEDAVFEFVYCALSFEKELKRNNRIFALKMLQNMRDYTLMVQTLNEDKKFHQFKAYDTLEPSFITEYLATYPGEISNENLNISAEKIKRLFLDTVRQSAIFSIETDYISFLLAN